MGVSIQTKVSRIALLTAIDPPLRSRVIVASAMRVREPRAFPEAPTPPALPTTIRDEMLELYAFIFRQGGFRQLGMTFEQFLLVAAAIKPADLPATREESAESPSSYARYSGAEHRKVVR
jgi:hypothetical protein